MIILRLSSTICITGISFSSFAPRFSNEPSFLMDYSNITFNDLPRVVAELRDEVVGMRQMLSRLQEENVQCKENTHRPMSVEEAAEYLKIPLRTLYMKLGNGTIPATKPGKRYVLYQDELDKWLETTRRNTVPMTADEENDAILASHKRKPDKHDWQSETDTNPT